MAEAGPDQSSSSGRYQLVLTAEFRDGEVSSRRRQVSRAARYAGLPVDLADDFVIAVNEIMATAVRHGGGGGLLLLWRGRDLLCQIDDQGQGFAASEYLDRVERPVPSSTGGMGLWVAQQTTDRLVIESGPTGTTVRISAYLPLNRDT
jgi:anti-sigma regulatory factor (Ser/Thr protein kinase)